MTGPAGCLLWLDPTFGAAGDMLLGSLLGLGAPIERVRADLDRLGIGGWALEVEPVTRSGLSATRAVVTAPAGHHHRRWSAIDATIAGAGLPEPVAAGARRTFARLAAVEAGIHRVPVDEVAFHEVGALDAIVDIVGTWSALDALGVGTVVTGPVGLGHGTVRSLHGRLPVPSPATADLLAGVAVHPIDIDLETVTPTGAALLTGMTDRWGPIPAGRIRATARGAGTKDTDQHPNVVTAILLDGAVRPGSGPAAVPEPAVVLSTNLDDVTPEVVARTVEELLGAGADDAWVVPVIMKKGRPGHQLHALASERLASSLIDLIAERTGTLGVRSRAIQKHRFGRRTTEVVVRGHTVRVKHGPYGSKPEHDDLVSASMATGVAIRLLADEARRAAAPDRPGPPGADPTHGTVHPTT
ncbi:MAG: nickel pincer cofactor biosynthesis protein LarC [Acidimicrobiales bacterium]